ncbi:hypothetical protein [Micromonospora sp. KC721]|uniref:hypothetical protein n=1 Tax=Micromonospora sp. KC721 TaxID=2530380 RepID=UPI0014050065|nr:hypothetical protein [Micromonospora sp. KC721]
MAVLADAAPLVLVRPAVVFFPILVSWSVVPTVVSLSVVPAWAGMWLPSLAPAGSVFGFVALAALRAAPFAAVAFAVGVAFFTVVAFFAAVASAAGVVFFTALAFRGAGVAAREGAPASCPAGEASVTASSAVAPPLAGAPPAAVVDFRAAGARRALGVLRGVAVAAATPAPGDSVPSSPDTEGSVSLVVPTGRLVLAADGVASAARGTCSGAGG